VHGRHHEGGGPDQSRRGGEGELQVGEAAALAQAGAVRADRDAPGDDQFD